MLGMDSTSSRRYFIQTRIITENKSKINPFLKKIWTGTDFFFVSLFPPLSSHSFFTKNSYVAKCPFPQKVKKASASRKILCNPCVFSTDRRGCGKLLWINLWRMWKTQLFPQVFPLRPRQALLCKTCAGGGHTSALREQPPESIPKRNLENLRQKVPIPPRLFEGKGPLSFFTPKNL